MKDKSKNAKLRTPYFDEGKADIPWNIYPRPQLKRDSFLCLNGTWDLCYKKGQDLPNEYNFSITVPFPPESELSGVERAPKRGEYLYYRKDFSLPNGFKREKTILHFGAVDGVCDVFLNGEHIKTNECG